MHFIPFRKKDVIAQCAADPRLQDRVAFEDTVRLIEAIFHFEFLQTLEKLKDAYAPVNADADTQPPPGGNAAPQPDVLLEELHKVLEQSNFVAISRQDLDRAMNEASLFDIRLEVDFDDFEEVLFFRRGETKRSEPVKSWLGLRQKEIHFTTYDRVLVYVRFKGQDYFAARGMNDLPFQPGATLLKLFRNVPRADLEMLFPNSEVRMRTFDKLMIGVPAAVGGVVMMLTKLGSTLVLIGALLAFWLGLRGEPVELDQAALLGLAAGMGTLGAFLWKQYDKFKNRKIRFMKSLSDQLYFRNLDNNAGVFHRLVDAAEEEECKEVILAWWLLLITGKPMSALEIDRGVEAWFDTVWQTKLDFEVEDALNKLERLGLADHRDAKWIAVQPKEARIALDQKWDGFFQFNGSSAEP